MRILGADTLAAISIIAALALQQWLVAAILVAMVATGGTLERFATRRASSVLEALAKRSPQIAHLRRADKEQDVRVSEVRVGDVLVVHPHELCPVDGVVVEGTGAMDESYLTGEPFELRKAPGSAVLSGAVNGEAALVIEARKLAVDSRYAAIMRVMEASTQKRPRVRRLADQLAAYYVPLSVAVAAAAWAVSGQPLRALAVLAAATPCPLLIGIPVAVLGAVSLAAKRSIVIRDPAILEQAPLCRTAIFDKTGTLTYGRPALSAVECGRGFARETAMRLAAALERYSRHPLAAAILSAADSEGIRGDGASEIRERPGRGLEGVVEGRKVRLTGRAQAEADGVAVAPTAGGLEAVLIVDGALAALFRFRDAPRPESKPFLAHLGRLHHFARVMLVSGDRASEVGWLAESVGIAEVRAGCAPEQKVDIVAAEAAKAPTLFVGDGINDAPALLRATAGVAIGTGSDVTASAAGAVLMTSDLAKVDELLHIGLRMREIALQSAIGGLALSVAAMIAAATGHLSPLASAIAQELIDVAAIVNALRAAWPGRLTDF